MSALVPIMLFGWIPMVIVSFAMLQPRRAVIAAYLIGWLFLPVATYDIPGFVDYGKGSATNVGVALGALIFDSTRVRALRWRWFDAAALLFCVCPFLSSMSNGLGLYDGISSTLQHVITWGLPYAIGRAYFSDGPGLEALAVGIAIGGLLYVPLCLWEIRMSPQLHATFYGYQQHAFDQARRGGGFRPVVFMQHGLAVGLWMGAATVVALTLWRAARRQKLLNLPMAFAALAIAGTGVLCKSSGATLLMLIGLGAVWLTRLRARPLVLYVLAVVPVIYLPIRATGAWSGEDLVAQVSELSPERAQSLGFRLEAENLLAEKARERWLLGWGGWGRSSIVVGEFDDVIIVTDSLWILIFGKHGAVGLIALVGMLVLPVVVFARRCPRAMWRHPRVAALIALAVVLECYMIDNLLNDMPNPIYLLIAGGVGAVRFSPAVRRAPSLRVVRSEAAHA